MSPGADRNGPTNPDALHSGALTASLHVPQVSLLLKIFLQSSSTRCESTNCKRLIIGQDALHSTLIVCAPVCRFVMFYEGVDDANRRSIGIAVSKNGRSGWKCHSRQAANPKRKTICRHLLCKHCADTL